MHPHRALWALLALPALVSCSGAADCADACPAGTRQASFDITAAVSGQQFYVEASCETVCETVQPCLPPNVPSISADTYRCAPLEGFADIPPADEIDFSYADGWADAPPADAYAFDGPQRVVALYADGDDIPDVAFSGADYTQLLLGEADGGLITAGEVPVAAGYYDSLLAADVDGDGLDDVIVSAWDAFSVLLSDGSGGLVDAGDVPGDVGRRGAAADLDGDGLADLVYAPAEATLEVAYGLGDATFPDAVPLSMSALASAGGGCSRPVARIADLDDDGDLDIVAICLDQAGSFLSEGGMSWRAGPRSTLPTNSIDDFSLGDVTGDGLADLVTHRDATLTVLPGDGSGGFGAARESTDGCDSIFQPLHRAPALVDLDGDGDLDAGVVGPGCGVASFYLQGDDGVMRATDRPFDGTGDHGAAADLDGDGSAELVVAASAEDTLFVVFR